MRAVVAFVGVAAVLLGIGVLVAYAVLDRPAKDLFLPLRTGSDCDRYDLRATGGLAWLGLEGGMWEFDSDGTVYDLYGVEGYLPADRIAWLQDHEGTHVPATVEGIVTPCADTFHMRGLPVRVAALDMDPDAMAAG